MKLKSSLLLLCGALLFSGCSDNDSHLVNIHSNNDKENYVTIHFETCTEEETNIINDQYLLPGSLVEEPAVFCIKNRSYKKRVEGWYIENTYHNKWDFLSDVVSSDLVLYARWLDVININYYLENGSEPIYTAKSVFVGQTLPQYSDLCDGYEFLGYYSDPACTIAFDLTTPLTSDQNVYLKHGDKFYFNAVSIKRRFSMMAATGPGSKAGTISDVQIDNTGEQYVDINFGYSKTADPHVNLSGLSIDISNSQKLKFKFKNFGHSRNVTFYWVSKYADGSYSANAQAYNETNVYREVLSESEYNMNENDPWVEKEFDLSQVIVDGKSSWGMSKTLVKLRFQFEYVSTSVDDLSNVVRIANIEGVPDSTHTETDDSSEVKALLSNDSEQDLKQASNNQTQNIGVIFPKNNNLISGMSSTYYKKVNGLLMYGIYGSKSNRYVFDVSEQNIVGSQYNSIAFKLRNYSYINNLTINITVKNTSTGKTTSNKATLSISTRMNQFNNFNLSLSGLGDMNGIVQTVRMTFDANGVDNAILLESVTFKV